MLCDYGLAQKIGGDEWYEWKADCCHSLPGPSWGGLEGRIKSQRKVERLAAGTAPGLASGLHGVRLPRPMSLYEQASRQEAEYKSLSRKVSASSTTTDADLEDLEKMKPWIMPDGWRDDLKQRWRDRAGFLKGWRPASGSKEAEKATLGAGRVGVLREDRR